jgi:hypothetical protein
MIRLHLLLLLGLLGLSFADVELSHDQIVHTDGSGGGFQKIDFSGGSMQVDSSVAAFTGNLSVEGELRIGGDAVTLLLAQLQAQNQALLQQLETLSIAVEGLHNDSIQSMTDVAGKSEY